MEESRIVAVGKARHGDLVPTRVAGEIGACALAHRPFFFSQSAVGGQRSAEEGKVGSERKIRGSDFKMCVYGVKHVCDIDNKHIFMVVYSNQQSGRVFG